MSGNERAGNGRGNSHGNNRRRPFKRRDKDNTTWQEGETSYENGSSHGGRTSRTSSGGTQRARAQNTGGEAQMRLKAEGNRAGLSKRGGDSSRGGAFFERPKWIPPKINTEPLPVPDCLWCGKPIRDISLAISDKDTGAPVHFECVAARIATGEILEKGEAVTYIGGGRFGIVYFGGSGDSHTIGRDFRIKKVIEWENKDKRAEWRSAISEHYSVT